MPHPEQDILTVVGAYTSALQVGADEWTVQLDVQDRHFTVNGYCEDLEQANRLRRILAEALLVFQETNHLKQVCVNCRRKRRADW